MVLPVLMAVGVALVRPASRRRWVPWSIGSLVVLAGYLALRSMTDAYVPATAPAHYALTFSPGVVLDNAMKSFDRAAAFAIGMTLLATILLARPAWAQLRTRWRLLAFGIAWTAAGYSITVFLPVRSELYACFPSIGTALIAGVIVEGAWRRAAEQQRRRALVAAVVVPLLLWPVAHARTQRWAGLATLSTKTIDSIDRVVEETGVQVLSIEDGSDGRSNLRSAFGNEIERAMRLVRGRTLEIELREPGDPVTPCPACARLELRLEPNGELRRIK